MKTQNKAFTLVELLVVISIIALLLGLVIPATNHVMKSGRVAAMKATIHSVSVGVEQFKTDKGSYPVSTVRGGYGSGYSIQITRMGPILKSEIKTDSIDVGAHHLAEAMFGLDKLGYSPIQLQGAGPQDRYYSVNDAGETVGYNVMEPIKRAEIYIDPSKLEVGTMAEDVSPGTGEIEDYNSSRSAFYDKVWYNPNPVILDKTNKKTPTPLLYFKANKRANLMTGVTVDGPVIYNFDDNADILAPYNIGFPPGYIPNNLTQKQGIRSWPQYIWDTKTGIGADEPTRFGTGAARPYNPDTFLLISGGPDGRFGTDDDITNFQRRE